MSPFFFGCRCCDHRRPTVGVCWSRTAETFMGSSTFNYHLMEIDDRTGEVNYDRTIDGWVYLSNSTGTGSLLYPHNASSWVIDTEGPEVQKTIDMVAGHGSIGLDPSGDWCVFTNRYRLIVAKNSVEYVWDGNSGNTYEDAWPDGFRPCRGTFYLCYYNYNSTVGGHLQSRLTSHVFCGDELPYASWNTIPGYTPDLYQYKSVTTAMPDGRICAYLSDYAPAVGAVGGGNVVPSLWFWPTEEFGTPEKVFMFAELTVDHGVIDNYGYRSIPYAIHAPPTGGILAYQQTLDQPLGYGHYGWEFTFYNTHAIWNVPVDFHDGDGDYVGPGVRAGTPMGATRDSYGIGVFGNLGGNSSTDTHFPFYVETCDVQQVKNVYRVFDPPDRTPGDYYIFNARFSFQGFAAIFTFWVSATHKFYVGRYDLDDLEWKWVVEIPEEDGHNSQIWAMATRP